MNFVKRFPHKAIYWGNPVPNGTGGQTYDDPIEIDCRWETISLVEIHYKDTQLMARHEVFLDRDVDEEGMMMLGQLADLDSAYYDTPDDLEDAYRIVRFDKIPNLRGNKYTRKCYLGRLWTGKT